ncbi:NUDIX hydrolase [Streptococcus oralis]|uniref:MutT/nudix family protein n=1 Tax=Streptococcus oralis TaxID=1303 RepID=A0A139Q066_STROR|nr:NUDIX hydrolase [Streptococcus oralis]KXT95612.1 MutT/nudix family protein [Streptococcus oralis]
MEIKHHFGVYGVCLQEGRLLCIEKTRGPYQHRYDLPGGSQELGEGLTETLKREVMEETGYTLSDYSNPRIYDVLVQENGQNFVVHHIMAFYDIEINEEEPQVTISEAVSDGANDSLGYIWMDIQKITEENASPLVLKVKAELLGLPELDKTLYMNWKVNDEKPTCP